MPLRIVLTAWGSYGDLFPSLGLAIRLQAMGHRPVLATIGAHRAVVEQAGLEFHRLSPDVEPTDKALIARIMDVRRGPEVVIRELIVPAVQQQYDDLVDVIRGADVVLSHPVAFAAPILAEQYGVRWRSTALAPLSFFSTTDFPELPGMAGTARFSRVGAWAGRALKGLARRATRAWTAPVVALRRSQGLPDTGDPLYEGQFSPCGTLALFSRVLAQPQPDWPPHTRVTGFVFYNGPGASLPAELAEFLDRGDPPVVFTLGSSAVGAAGSFYEDSARAAVQLGVRAVLLTGPLPENRPKTTSANICVVDGAPHDQLFPRASAIVHHGGVGTTGQALASGHPMLIVPFSHDQPDNGHRIRELGVGRVLYPTRYGADRVAAELRALLAGTYATRASEVGRIVRAEDGTSAACEEITRPRD